MQTAILVYQMYVFCFVLFVCFSAINSNATAECTGYNTQPKT